MTVRLIVDVDTKGIENMLAAAGARAPVAIARALNRAGEPAKNAYLRQLRVILGLKNWRYANKQGQSAIQVLKNRTSARNANPARLEYSLVGFGEGFNAKYYDPKEAPVGANINWLGSRKTIAHSFYLGGAFPNRKVARGLTYKAVFRRGGDGKWTGLDRPKGPGVPEAMNTSAAQAVWLAHARARLPKEMSHQLYAILAGHARGSWKPT
jgi:hypothetical protein